MESLSMVSRFAKHFAEADDVNELGAWVSHLYNHYNKMANRSGLTPEEIAGWGQRRPGVWETPEEEAGAAITCMVQALHYAATPGIQRHQTGEYEAHITLLRQNSIREPLVDWAIPSLDIPLYCSVLTQPDPTIYDVTFGHAHYNREFRLSMGLPAEPAGRELGKSLEEWVEDMMDDKDRDLSDWTPQEMKWARQSAARCTGDMLDALWLRYFYDGDEQVHMLTDATAADCCM
jgi:hypothetical protein